MTRTIHASRWRPTDPGWLVRTALGLAAREGLRAAPRPAEAVLTIREQALFRAATRRRLRAATVLAGMTLSGLAALNAVGLTRLFPERQVQALAINGAEAAVALIVTALALRPRRVAPVLLAATLAVSTVVTVLHLLVFVPESRTASLMLLAVLPPAVALFLPWGATVQAGWLLTGAVALAVFTASGAGAGVSAGDWASVWLVLAISGTASLVGCAGTASVRRRSFEHQRQAHRAHAQTAAREADLERLNGDLARASQTDPLTGLGNRLRMNDELAAAAARSSRYGQDCAVVLLDLDRFKAYNDTLGHVTGDAALRTVAAALVACVREVDTVCRFGGEEFLVVMPEQTREGAAVAAERMRAAVEDLGLNSPTPTGSRPLTISAGVAIMGRRAAQNPDEAVRAADAALYRAKVLGRNRITVDVASRRPTHRIDARSADPGGDGVRDRVPGPHQGLRRAPLRGAIAKAGPSSGRR